MRIRELAGHWEQNAKGRRPSSPYQIHLDVEAAAPEKLGDPLFEKNRHAIGKSEYLLKAA